MSSVLSFDLFNVDSRLEKQIECLNSPPSTLLNLIKKIWKEGSQHNYLNLNLLLELQNNLPTYASPSNHNSITAKNLSSEPESLLGQFLLNKKDHHSEFKEFINNINPQLSNFLLLGNNNHSKQQIAENIASLLQIFYQSPLQQYKYLDVAFLQYIAAWHGLPPLILSGDELDQLHKAQDPSQFIKIVSNILSKSAIYSFMREILVFIEYNENQHVYQDIKGNKIYFQN